MKCPSCGLINPSNAQICDCGYNFETQARGKPIRGSTSMPVGDLIVLPSGKDFALASLGSRFLGQILDGIIAILLGLCSFAVLYLFKVSVGVQTAIFIVVIYGYFLFSDGFKGGQSLGKRVLKTAVIDSFQGKPCSYGQSLARNFLQILGIIDWIFIFGKKRQRLGDKAAGTIVVRSPE
jgi:uncharacterized RDD family membrane protein YckC